MTSLDSVSRKDRKVIEIRLALSSGAVGLTNPRQTTVVFTVSVGGEQVALLQASPSEIGLPMTLAAARSKQASDDDYRLPDYLLAGLTSVLPTDEEPVCLSIQQPAGYVPVVPWERLLKTRIAAPIVRLPYTLVQPKAATKSLEAILCFTFPVAKQETDPGYVVTTFLSMLPPNLGDFSTLHLFGDWQVQAQLHQFSATHQAAYPTIVYDPVKASRYDVPEPDTDQTQTGDRLESPWLLWIRDELGARSVDIVHFVCHGFLGREDGLLAVSQSPVLNDDQDIARFIGVRQLSSFLDQVGAWSVGFTSQPHNYSVAGLRMLQDQIARLRPGPTLFHDMTRDSGGQGLVGAYACLQTTEPPSTDAVTLYCNPDLFKKRTASDEKVQHILNELTLSGRMADVFESPENTPSWLASGQRGLERSVADLLSSAPERVDTVLQSGAADALRFTSDVLQRHAALIRASGIKGVK
jgi:hypothetical protein